MLRTPTPVVMMPNDPSIMATPTEASDNINIHRILDLEYGCGQIATKIMRNITK